MAADFGVHFATSKLPTIAMWEQAADDLRIRLRVTSADLKTHRGVLPITFGPSGVNSGFEFQLTNWGLPEAFRDLLGDQVTFAHFRCFRREWEPAVWAAVSFAKASDGVFENPQGLSFRTLEDAIAFAKAQSLPEADRKRGVVPKIDEVVQDAAPSAKGIPRKPFTADDIPF